MNGQTGVILAYTLSIAGLWLYALIVLLSGRAVARKQQQDGRTT